MRTLAFALAIGSVSPAFAADIVRPISSPRIVAPAAYTWTGFYAGFTVGGDGGSSTFTDLPSGNTLPWLITGDTFTARRVGPNIGLEAGYNAQISAIVLGIEGDIGYLGGHGRGESQSISPPGNGIYGYIQSGGYASLRARAGIAMHRVLLFATAGGILADHGAYMDDAPDSGLTGETGFVGGWIVGGGLEYALSDHWAAKFDALYYSLADKIVRGADPVAGPSYNVASNGTIVRLGFNYRF